MKIKDYRDAQLHYTKDDRGDATGAFEMFVAEEPSSMVQEPRNSFSRGGLALAQMLLKNLNKTKPIRGLEEKLIKKFRSEGIDLLEAIKKAQAESTTIKNNAKNKILDDAMKETDITSDDYVELIDQKIKIIEPEYYADIKRWSNDRPDLADKTRALFYPDWAEAKYGENYVGVLQNRQAKTLKTQSDEIDKMYPDSDGGIQDIQQQTVTEIDDMNTANLDELLEGRKKNATGGLQRNMYADGLKVDPVAASGKMLNEVIDAYERYRGGRKNPVIKFNKFFEIWARENFVDGGSAGQLVQPSGDGSRPGYQGKRVFDSPDVDAFSDALLDAYAKDDITKIVESGKSTKFANVITAIESGKDKSAKLAKVIKNTGLDEETIFNLLDDRKAYIDLAREGGPAGANPRAGNFYKKAENWITTNSKRYADPDKFKKAFIRTFGTNNDLIKTMKKLNVPGARKKTSVPFSSWFKETILGSTKGSGASYNFNQLNNIFKTSIYTNNENVRNNITKEIKKILDMPMAKGGKFDIRNEIANNKLFKQFGFDRQIRGPIARLLANEIGQELLDQVSSFRDPYLGTTELIRFLKNNVDPKYKSMFEEAAKAADLAAKNKWPEAKQILKIKDNIMFDHKIPKELIKLGYADELEYIKLNPTSAEFNTRIKNPQFDQKIIKLAKDFKRTTSLDDKAKVVEKMNILKNNFSKKYGGYLDEVSIVPDKTGKPIFKSSAAPVTKQTDFVSALGKSMTQAGEITQKKANLLSQFCNRKKLQSAGSVQGLTCSMEEIQTNMKKQINEAAKVSKDGKIPKKFGKLRGFAKMFFGDIAIPLEYMFMAPDLAAGDVEGALRSSTAGLFGAGKVDLEKLPPGEGKKYIKHVNALTNFLNNYQSKLMAENRLEKLEIGDEGQTESTDKLAQAEKNMADIIKNYQGFGYTYAPGEKGLLEGKVEAQKLIRDKVTSDFDKKIDKGASTEFFKDSNKELLKENLRSLGGDPYKVTPINNLEDYIKNKGEATAGNTNILFNRLPYTLEQAEAYGVPQIFDTYAGGYAGVETPGSMEDGQVDMGTKDVRDAYSSLPINMASQLAALEKKEFEEGMLKRRLEQELFAGGGIAGLSGGDKSGPPPESGPASQGLRSLIKNGRKL